MFFIMINCTHYAIVIPDTFFSFTKLSSWNIFTHEFFVVVVKTTQTHTHAQTQSAHTHTQMHTHICINAHIQAYIQTCMHTCKPARMHWQGNTHTQTLSLMQSNSCWNSPTSLASWTFRHVVENCRVWRKFDICVETFTSSHWQWHSHELRSHTRQQRTTRAVLPQETSKPGKKGSEESRRKKSKSMSTRKWL